MKLRSRGRFIAGLRSCNANRHRRLAGRTENTKTNRKKGCDDLYYRDRRDVTSIVIPEGDIGVEVIYEPLTVDNMLFCPWMIKDENLPDLIEEYKPEYVFCHPEIPTFSFNKVTKYDTTESEKLYIPKLSAPSTRETYG